MEIPTQEILFQLHQKGIDTIKLKELLTRADLAKFAKAKPLQIENEESLKNRIRLYSPNKTSKRNR